MNRSIKTEHAGAKNGGGSYGHRVDVKQVSRKLRRASERVDVEVGQVEYAYAREWDGFTDICGCEWLSCPWEATPTDSTDPYDQDDEDDESESDPEDYEEPPADRMEFPGHEGM